MFFFSGRQQKIAGSAQKTGSVGLAETQVSFQALICPFIDNLPCNIVLRPVKVNTEYIRKLSRDMTKPAK